MLKSLYKLQRCDKAWANCPHLGILDSEPCDHISDSDSLGEMNSSLPVLPLVWEARVDQFLHQVIQQADDNCSRAVSVTLTGISRRLRFQVTIRFTIAWH